MSDEPGVMGNLPRSRPGRRSAKRGGAGEGPKRAAEVKPAKPKTTRAKAAKPVASAKAKRTTGAAKAKAGGSAKAAGGSARTTPKAGGSAKAPGGSARTTPAGRTKPTRARVGGPAATTPSAGLDADTAPETAVRDERVETPPSSDPITSALRLGMAVGDAGLKAVAKIVERLPRP